ncbi:23S rRNA (adenine(1618)-N(6))-methyltransferase RlmF [Frischella perrara]|uniref:Ribosomal RNA large subunit methyltransferase F n=1 Tax=Frischella perrara TaxID=1267021 RepID=A0A0A7RZE8_FRIPE|nr:23S rRNA (adenine(1618)-N(6))-methyltransferase RlmF [Frischella perrara]AJA44695.1 23S rRNA m(6)A-1618 methyltransferase [Frischella perrara]PWV64983.1 23S rRNA m(6)A-1618 methyltransferase [Frischella perrara]
MPKGSSQIIKKNLHPRNRHRTGYDFPTLGQILPELSGYIIHNQYGKLSIDYANPKAVKLLNKALLLQSYRIKFWDIPDDYLCPPIPGRADYIHYLADLLAMDNYNRIPQGKAIRLLDIGVGANTIYPIIGHTEYGWSFVGSDISATAIKMAKLIAKMNPPLTSSLTYRWQKNKRNIFTNIIKPNEQFALTLCNPPFHASLAEAQAATNRKLTNLGKTFCHVKQPVHNFGGQNNELWCDGGEVAFINTMIEESKNYKDQCLWFTSLISKKDTLSIIKKKLEKIKIQDLQVVTMAQGQKISRFIAWSFLNSQQRQQILARWQR